MEQESLFSKKALVISALVVASLAVFYVQWKSSALSNASVSLLPCCGAVSFSTELNAVYFMSLCAHLRGPQLSPPSSTAADDAAGSWWSRQLASWCVEQLRSQCGVRVHEAAVEWHRRGASFRRNASSVDAAVSGDGAHLDRCLELRFNTRRGDVRPSRVSPLPHTTQTHEWLSRTVDHGRLKDTAPVVTDTSSHAAQQAHQSARPSPPHQGMRTLDRIARPGPMPSSRPSPGGPGAMVQPQSKSSGPLSIIMPIYSVAIVVFFFYTVAKVVTRRSGPVSGDQRCRDPVDLGHGSRVMHRQSCTDTGGVERGSVPGSHKRVSYCNNSDAGSIISDEARAGAESTTQAADNPPPTDTTSAQPTVSKRSVEARTTTQAPDNDDVEIEDLKQRLAETEMAMEMIMKQLGSVSAQLSCSPPPADQNRADLMNEDTGNKPTGITDKHRERVNNSKQLQSGNSAPECADSEDPVVGGADNKCDGGVSGDGVDTSQSLVARDQEEHK